ncbi:MAG: GGDEF domain-containing protein, partial [Myxococcota bacterium]
RRQAVDAPTQLPRRAQLAPVLRGRLAEAARHGLPFTLAFVELDGHQAIVDRHGHGTGQRVLGAIASLLRARFRLEDLRARWAVPTFALGLTGSEAEAALPALKRLAREAGGLRFQGSGGVRFGVRLSCGAASVPGQADTLPALVLAAEERLRAAQAGGGGVRGPEAAPLPEADPATAS